MKHYDIYVNGKMIVKNCPAYLKQYNGACNERWNAQDLEVPFCKDCPDCVIKQIIKPCLQYKKFYDNLPHSTPNIEDAIYCIKNKNEYYFRILELLDVEEIDT